MPWQTQSICSGLSRARIPLGWRWEFALPAPRGARALGGGRVSRAEACPWGPIAKYRSVPKKQNGNAIFVTAQAPNRSLGNYGICTARVSGTRNREKNGNPGSSDPQSGHFLGDRYGTLDCTHAPQARVAMDVALLTAWMIHACKLPC